MNTAAVIFLGNSINAQNHKHFMTWQSNKELVHENNYFGTHKISVYITLKFKYTFLTVCLVHATFRHEIPVL